MSEIDSKRFFDFTAEPVEDTEITHDDFVALIKQLPHLNMDQLRALQEEVDLELNYRENFTPEESDNDA